MLADNLQYQVVSIGQEQQPIIVIDNFVADPAGLVAYALGQQDVMPAAGHYPGLRSKAPGAYQAMLCQRLSPLLCQVFGLAAEQLTQAECYYSMVATPVNQLSVVQQLPHFDQPKRDELAVIHYLCGEPHGGTSFYRHRSSGYEYVDQQRLQGYISRLENDIQRYGMPRQPCYINGENVFFERVTSVRAVFNRAVVYRCSSLHSGDIPSDYQFDMNPTTGRFTVASFIHS